MAKKFKLAAVIVNILTIAVFVFAPVLMDETAVAAESADRNWDSLTDSSGDLRSSATATSYAILIDAKTGEVLYEEHADSKRYPASITKIMTCLVVLENADLQDTVTIGDLDVEDGASIIGLQYGEVISVEDLLYGLMLESGGDAAVALAQYVAGSVDDFVDMMNEKAAELGMTSTNFENPIGMHDSSHYSTARDMATMTYYAMQNTTFRKIVGTEYYTPPTTNKHGDTNAWYPTRWQNSNLLISSDDDEEYAFNDSNGHAIGVKTGYTSASLHTLVSAAESADGSMEVIAVVMYEEKYAKWTDSITMFLYAFEFYDTLDLGEFLTDDLVLTAHVENAADADVYDNLEVYVVPDTREYITDKTEVIEALESDPDRFTMVETYTVDLVAPIAKDDELGIVEIYLDDDTEPIMTCTMIAANDVEAIPTATEEATATPEPDEEDEEADATAAPAGTVGTVGYVGYFLAGFAGCMLMIVIFMMVKRKAKYFQYNVSAKSKGKHSATNYEEGVKRGKGRRK